MAFHALHVCIVFGCDIQMQALGKPTSRRRELYWKVMFRRASINILWTKSQATAAINIHLMVGQVKNVCRSRYLLEFSPISRKLRALIPFPLSKVRPTWVKSLPLLLALQTKTNVFVYRNL